MKGTTNNKRDKGNSNKRVEFKEKAEEEDIERLIEEEIRAEERKTQERKKTEDHTKNAALELVNEFIQNETRNSFQKQKRKVKKKKTTTKATEPDTTETNDIETGEDICVATGEEASAKTTKSGTKPKGKKKKPAKIKKAECVIIEMDTEHGEDTPNKPEHANSKASASEYGMVDIDIEAGDTHNERITKKKKTANGDTKEKKKKTTKKKKSWEKFDEKTIDKEENEQAKIVKTKKKTNKISPTPPPPKDEEEQEREEQEQEEKYENDHKKVKKGKGNTLKTKLSRDLVLESFSEDATDAAYHNQRQQPVENSLMTIVLMTLCLESELPVAFYKKLVKSRRLKNALQSLTCEERSLVLAMMEDLSPSIDVLPNGNKIFIDSFKDRLTVVA